MLVAFNSIVSQVSADNAGRYAASTADAISANIVMEVGIVGKAARSAAVTVWLADEHNAEKKTLAFEEFSNAVGELYSSYLSVTATGSHNYYIIDEYDTLSGFQPFSVLDKSTPEHLWFFDMISSDKDYLLNVAMDDVVHQKRVWLNYNVVRDGVNVGVISTWLDFSSIAGELFVQYDNTTLRGLIIDENGIINLDSALIGDMDADNSSQDAQIEEELGDPVFLEIIRSHLDNVDGVFETRGAPMVIELESSPYRFATIAGIKGTPWSMVVLYNPSSFLSLSLFLPVISILIALLIAFALIMNAVRNREIFKPLDRLSASLLRLKEDSDATVYGIEREDEIGNLSKTIMDLFTQANYDALTGIYNRNYMDSTFQNIMHMLSRSNGILSVLMIDVDFFKKYNDEYGHDKGDYCLKAVAKTLSDSITRKEDFVARYGGEEFLAILPNTDEAGVRIIANRLLESVRRMALPHGRSSVADHVTVSIGATTGNVLFTQAKEVFIKRADEAMYSAKQSGRDRYVFMPLSSEYLFDD